MKVVYLFGAGATNACVKYRDLPQGVLMGDLIGDILARARVLVEEQYGSEPSLVRLLNGLNESTDIEHIVTFMDDSSSLLMQTFAEDFRTLFEEVLRRRFGEIHSEFGGPPNDLYRALLDMHRIEALDEQLRGILTLNYDGYIEDAIDKVYGVPADFGIQTSGVTYSNDAIKLLKLHGSFTWDHSWPVHVVEEPDKPLWIPPGIFKAKDKYPFNVLWGSAREVLDCDVLRIVGCRLGANDWDLISMIYSTRYANSTREPYTIELIDSLANADRLKRDHPYLDIKNLFELEPFGGAILSELIGDVSKQDLSDLGDDDKGRLLSRKENWFKLWLQHKGEAMLIDSIDVASTGDFGRFLDA